MRYRILTTNNIQLDSISKLATDFGLSPCFSNQEIFETWSVYSITNGSFWLEPTKAGVEEAFSVTLEELPAAKIKEIKQT